MHESKNILVVGHVTQIYGPVQALLNYAIGTTQNVTSILHPLPYSPIRSSQRTMHHNGTLLRTRNFRLPKRPEILCYIQQLLLTLVIIVKERQHYATFIGIDNLNAFCGIVLRKFGLVDKTIFYVIDYTPNRFSNSMANRFYHIVDEFCIKRSDFIWNISKKIQMIRQNQGLKEYKNLVVPVGIELNKITHAPPDPDGRFTLLFVSHLDESKGVELVIEAMKEINRLIPATRLEIIGTGPQEEKLRRLVQKMGLDRCIKFLGVMDHDKLLSYIPTKGIGLATYLDDPNSITYFADPTKPKEYLACGLPVIITKVPWISTEINKIPMGVTINYNRDELIGAVMRLMKDSKFYDLCRKNALEFTSNLDWNTIFGEAFSQSGIL